MPNHFEKVHRCLNLKPDDFKKKLRMSWGLAKDFDMDLRKGIKKITNTSKQSELGSWKSERQLQQHSGGAQFSEACRHEPNYVRMAKHFSEAFVECSHWKPTCWWLETYLLVERLSPTSTIEGW